MVPEEISKTLEKDDREESKRCQKVVVAISEDEMVAQVVINYEDNEQVTVKEVLDALEKAQVAGEIDLDCINKALNSCVDYPVVVARGTFPKDGKDAEIIYHFPVGECSPKPEELEGGKVNHHDLKKVFNVTEGQLLATKIPAVTGVAGKNVRGKILHPRIGRDKAIMPGKNTVLSQDGKVLTALAPGYVLAEGNKISVCDVYVVQGDVDFSTGNIDFVGSIQIYGGIKYGFSVRAGGNIEVKKTIEGASIFAGGNLIVLEGIRGQGKGKVTAKGDLSARFLENADVRAGGDVCISEAIMHSHVVAGGKVLVRGRKGLIVGGFCRAGGDIEAKTVGSHLATVTNLEAGNNPELRELQEKLMKELEEATLQFENIEKTLRLIEKLKETKKELPQEKTKVLLKIIKGREQILASIAELKEKENAVSEKLTSLAEGKIRIHGFVFPGVVLKIGQAVSYVRDPLQFVSFYLEGNEVIFGAYDKSIC